MTDAIHEPYGSLTTAVDALLAVFDENGGGWVHSRAVKDAMTRSGFTSWELRAARMTLGVRTMRTGGRHATHRSLWCHPGDTRRVTNVDGRDIVTYLDRGESGDALAERHREQVRRALGRRRVALSGKTA